MRRSSGRRGSGHDDLRVAFVSQFYPPEPVTTPAWIASALRKQNCHVAVLTGTPNHPQGRTLPGYRAWHTRSTVHDGLRVLHCPLYPSHDRSASRRVANYLSWAASASVVGQRVLAGADVSLVYSSPATAALPAMAARLLHGTPYVLLVQDVWPDSVVSTGFLRPGAVSRTVLAALEVLVQSTYRHAAHVAVTSPGMLELLAGRGVPRHKLSLVYNWVDEQVYRPTPPDPGLRQSLGLTSQFVLMYAGNHGPAQQLRTLVDVMATPSAAGAHLVIIGDGVDKPDLVTAAARVAPGRVHFLPPVNASEMPALMAAADVQLVSLRDDPLFRVTTPSKLQSIFASARPVIAVCSGDVGDAVREAGAGWVCEPGDVRGLSSMVDQARSTPPEELVQMGLRGREHYLGVMSQAVNSSALADALRSAACRAGSE